MILFLSFVQISNNENTPIPITPWAKSDLKLLDPIDSNSANSCEILAVFLRKVPNNFEIRVDFLYENDVLDCVLRINFRKPGQENFFLLDVNSTEINNSPISSVTFNEQQKYIFISLPANYFKYEVNFIACDKNHESYCDSTNFTSLFVESPSPILINLFAYNSHLGYMPSQILRNWDGAHTGPNGQRHGLKHFLSAAKATNTPVTLLDINTHSGLAALEFLGVANDIIDLQKSSILFLPITVNLSGPIGQLAQDFSLESAINHNYLNQNLIYYNSNNKNILIVSDNKNLFINKLNTINLNFIPIEKGKSDPFTKNGLSEDTLKFIMQQYFSDKGPFQITFSISDSNVADKIYADNIFTYISNHPWIEIISPVKNNYYIYKSYGDIENSFKKLQNFPEEFENRILQLNEPFLSIVINYLNDIYGRIQSPEFKELSNQYISNIYYYINANNWAESPIIETSCDSDIDFDGFLECTISNNNYYAIIELDGGRLGFLATRTQDNVYQIIAPSSTIMYGLGVPNEGNSEAGVWSDLDEIPGAFYDPQNNWYMYKPLVILNNEVIIKANEFNKIKHFLLEEDGLYYKQSDINNSPMFVPVILTPNCVNQVNWQNQYKISTMSNQSKISIQCSSESVTITSDNSTLINVSTFLESIIVMNIPENPDYSYLNGHYQKLGLSLIQITNTSRNLTSVHISK